MSARSNWVRPFVMSFAPIITLSVIALGYLIFFAPRVVCCRISPRGWVQADIVSIFSATMEFAMNHDGHFPTRLEELVEPDALGYRYLARKSLPQDPWGHPYLYVQPSGNETEPNVISLGADGEIGGTGEDADIDLRTLIAQLPGH